MRHIRKKPSKLILPVLAGALVLSAPFNTGMFQPVPIAAAAETVTYKLVKQGEAIVTSGARNITYAWVPSDSSKPTEMLHVLEIDLNNPYIELNAISGRGGSVTSGQSVTAMAKETGAVAAVNGDVFVTTNEGAPMGAQINSGELVVSTSELKGMFAFAVTKDKKPMIDQFNFTGKVHAADGTAFDLTGLNKSAYRTDPDKGFSHYNKLYMYTSAWTAPERPASSSTTPTEALIVDGVVTDIAEGKQIATAIPPNGYILRGHGTAATFITDHLNIGDKVNYNYELQSLTNGKTYDPSSFQMMVGGHTLLLDKGVATSFTRDVNGLSGYADRARTAVGYSKDGSKAYLLTVEEHGGREGVTLKELQQMMVQLGMWKGVNLDGGGSTTMVTRPLGEFQVELTHPTAMGGTTQRQVSNGIGVYTNAPQGSLKGIVASGASTLFIGQEAGYSLKAYDNYYNPIDPNGLKPIWSVNNSIGAFSNGILKPNRAGEATLTVKAGTAKDTLPLEVIGQSQVKRLIVEPSTSTLTEGSEISVPVKAELMDGRLLTVPAASVKWEFVGFTANASGGKLTVNKVNSSAPAGYAIARYDGYGTVAILTPGAEKSLENFENVAYNIGFTGDPAETTGSATIVSGIPGRESSKVLKLAYDFTAGSGNRFAYAMLNDGNGVAIDGNASSMTLDVLGDNSMNWLRAEAIDASGEKIYLTIARQINWSGWQNIRVDLAAAGLKGPAKLTRLYVVNLEQDQDERAMQGEVAMDNLTLQYPPGAIDTVNPTIVMTVGKTQATVDGKTVKLPGAPFVQPGTNSNYLPLRFVADTLGAQVKWNNTDKRVTVLRGDKMLELWVGRKDMTVNGVRQSVAVDPIVKNGSVYVPVRVVSEQLGQKVEWKGATKTITIR